MNRGLATTPAKPTLSEKSLIILRADSLLHNRGSGRLRVKSFKHAQ